MNTVSRKYIIIIIICLSTLLFYDGLVYVAALIRELFWSFQPFCRRQLRRDRAEALVLATVGVADWQEFGLHGFKFFGCHLLSCTKSLFQNNIN